MKKALLASTVMALTLCPAAQAESIRVNVVSGLPPVFLWVKHMQETFIPEVDKALEGSGFAIEWTESFGGSLAKQGGELEALEAQLAEIGVVPTVFEGSNLPLQNVTYMAPFGSSDPELVLRTMNDLHNSVEGMRKSWNTYDIEYLGGGFAIDDYMLLTTFPVNGVADLEGRKIGAPGPAVNWVKGTGAVGVAGSLHTYYNDIQTGVFDGIIVFATAAAPAKLHEVAPYITKTKFGSQYAGSVVANKTWFDAQPALVQEAMRAAAERYTAAYIDELVDRVDASLKLMEEEGATISELPADERVKWASALPNVPAEWAAQAESEGLPAQNVLNKYMQALRTAGTELPRDWDKEH